MRASHILSNHDELSYAYEKGAFSTITINWNDSSRTLTLGERKGEFPGMLEKRRFTVIVVDPEHPASYNPDAEGECIQYCGAALSKSF